MGATFSSRDVDIENGSVSVLIVRSATAPVPDTDADTDNDGNVDASLNWNVVDSYGNIDGGASDTGYGAFNTTGNGNGTVPTGAVLVNLSGYHPDYAARIGSSTGASAADWVVGELAGSMPTISLAVGFTSPSNLGGAPINHLGALNVFAAQSLIVSTTSVSVNEGSTNTFTVRLAAQPTSDVTVNVTRTSGDTDLTVSGGGTLTFTTANWNTPQTVTLSAAEDADTVNGTAMFAIASSGLTSVNVNATEADNDTQSLIVSTTSVSVNEGSTNTFTVRLAAQPTSDVTVNVTRTSGDTDLTVSGGGTLTFTTANWNTPQTVTLSAAEDADTVNGTAIFSVASSGLTSVNVNATEADNDTQSLIVSTTSVSVNEGSTNTFTVRLAAQPTSDVTVNVTRTSGDTDLSVSGGGTLTFTTANWNTPQTVTLSAAEDADTVNGTAIFAVASSGLTSIDVNATEADNDTQSLIVSTTSVSVNEGSTNTFTVRLAAQPASDVTVNVTRTSGDTDLSVSGGGTLTFTTANWNTPQTVTLSAAEDADTVNGTAVFAVASSGLTSVNVNATEADNDTQSLIVSTTSVSVNEGSTNTFTVRLAAQPTSDVTVNVTRTSGDTDLTVSGGGTLTFTTANWNTPQTVTLSAAEDADTVNGTAVFAVASSGLTSIDVNATEADNDTQSLIVSTTSVSVNEGSTNTFTVRLAAQPTSDVTVNVTRTSGDTDLTVSGGGTLTFTTANWNTPQTVTLSAAEDADTVNGTAIFSVASSGLTTVNVNATEADNDTQSLIVSTTS